MGRRNRHRGKLSAAGPSPRPPGRPKDAAAPSGEASLSSSGERIPALAPGGRARSAIGGDPYAVNDSVSPESPSAP